MIIVMIMIIPMNIRMTMMNGGDDVEENDDILGVICDVDALSLRWRSPENCHDMFES